MIIKLKELGGGYTATPLVTPANPAARTRRAEGGQFQVEPGVWILSRAPKVDIASLPATINRVGLTEYHVSAPETFPDLVQNLTAQEFVEGSPTQIRVRAATAKHPAALRLFYRQAGGRFGAPVPLRHLRGYDYEATLEGLTPGHYEFIVIQDRGDRA